MNKIIVIDSGFVGHKAIFAKNSTMMIELCKILDKEFNVKIKVATPEQKEIAKDILFGYMTNRKIFIMPSNYNYLNFVYSYLKKIGIDRDTKILIAKDGRNSFRKAFLPAYKGNRAALREQTFLINWSKEYALIAQLEDDLEESSGWNCLQFNKIFNFADLCLTKEGQEFEIEDYDIDYGIEYGLESDDIQALVPKVFPDHEVVLVTIDQDISQLYHWKNIKVFNPNLQSPTNKAKKGYYVIENDPLGVISKKVRTGDKSDNILIDKPHDTERDVDIRRFIIGMLDMPDYIETPIISGLKNLDWNKKVDYQNLPFPNSLAKKFDSIYETNNVRTWEESVERDLLKKMKEIEKRSKRSVEEIYEKNKNYKILKDKYDECKNKKKKKVVV